jgi:hypothetical protein
MTADSLMEQLVHEALNLVVRARKLDEGIRAQERCSRGSYDPQQGHSITPHHWLLDQYDTDLKEWETRARNALSGSGRAA